MLKFHPLWIPVLVAAAFASLLVALAVWSEDYPRTKIKDHTVCIANVDALREAIRAILAVDLDAIDLLVRTGRARRVPKGENVGLVESLNSDLVLVKLESGERCYVARSLLL